MENGWNHLCETIGSTGILNLYINGATTSQWSVQTMFSSNLIFAQNFIWTNNTYAVGGLYLVGSLEELRVYLVEPSSSSVAAVTPLATPFRVLPGPFRRRWAGLIRVSCTGVGKVSCTVVYAAGTLSTMLGKPLSNCDSCPTGTFCTSQALNSSIFCSNCQPEPTAPEWR